MSPLGTGCAPFIACLHERIAQQGDDASENMNVYVFGNRNKHGDFLHQDAVEVNVFVGVGFPCSLTIQCAGGGVEAGCMQCVGPVAC